MHFMRTLMGAGLVAMTAGCATANEPFRMYPRYTPTSEQELVVTDGSGPALAIAAVVDQRVDREAIGFSTEASPDTRITAPPRYVTQVVSNGFTTELRGAGYVVDAAGPIRLTVTVLEYWVNEDELYRGRARFKVDVEKEGAKVASLTVSGRATRWGSGESEENYNEVLSDALVDAVHRLVIAGNFRAATLP